MVKKDKFSTQYEQKGNLQTDPQAQNKLEAAKLKKYGSNTNNFSANNKTIADIPLLHRDASNKINGVSLPNGDTFNNVDPETAQKIVDDWNNQNAEPANSMYADVYAKKQAEEQAKQAQEAAKQAEEQNKKALLQSGLELSKSINQIDYAKDLTKAQDSPIGQDIRRLQIQKKDLGPAGVISDFAGGIKNLLNTEFLGGNLGTDTVNQLAYNNPKFQEFLNGYSNKKNFETLVQSAENSKTAMLGAIRSANQATTTEQQINAQMQYKAGYAKLREIQILLKQISDTDKKKYTEEVLKKEADLKEFMSTITVLNDRMVNALKSPNPNAIDVNMQGG